MCVGIVCTQPPYNDKKPPGFFFFLSSKIFTPFSNRADLRCLSVWWFFSRMLFGRASRKEIKKRKCFHQKKISSIFSYQTRLELQMRLASLNMIKEGCENESALLILLIFYFGNPHKSNLSLDNKNLKWGEMSLWNKCFSLIHIGHN